LAGATRPAAGGRATAAGAGRPDRRGQANDGREASAAPGVRLRRDGPEAERPLTAGRVGRKRKSPWPDARIKWRGPRRRQRGGGLLCRSGGPGSLSSLRVPRNGRPGRGIEAGAPIPPERRGKAVSSSDRAFGRSSLRRFSVSPLRRFSRLSLQTCDKEKGESEGIAFPRRGPGAAPRSPEARR